MIIGTHGDYKWEKCSLLITLYKAEESLVSTSIDALFTPRCVACCKDENVLIASLHSYCEYLTGLRKQRKVPVVRSAHNSFYDTLPTDPLSRNYNQDRGIGVEWRISNGIVVCDADQADRGTFEEDASYFARELHNYSRPFPPGFTALVHGALRNPEKGDKGWFQDLDVPELPAPVDIKVDHAEVSWDIHVEDAISNVKCYLEYFRGCKEFLVTSSNPKITSEMLYEKFKTDYGEILDKSIEGYPLDLEIQTSVLVETLSGEFRIYSRPLREKLLFNQFYFKKLN